MSTRALRSAVLGAVALASSAALASPTGLYLMPIADILKHREAFAYVGLTGYERRVFKGYDHFNAATVGLFNRIEVGYDQDFMGTLSANAKVQLVESKGYALSAGFTNWRGDAIDPFAVARFDGKGYRLHGGWWRTGGASRLMAGTDFPVARGLTGSLEFLSGPESQGWAGLFYSIPRVEGLGVMAALGVSSDHAVGVQHSALLVYSFKL